MTVDCGIGSMVIRSSKDGANCDRFLPTFSGRFSCELQWVWMELQGTKRLDAGAVVKKAPGFRQCGVRSIAVSTPCLSWVCWVFTLLWQFLLCIFWLLYTPSSYQNQRVSLLILQTSSVCFNMIFTFYILDSGSAMNVAYGPVELKKFLGEATRVSQVRRKTGQSKLNYCAYVWVTRKVSVRGILQCADGQR